MSVSALENIEFSKEILNLLCEQSSTLSFIHEALGSIVKNKELMNSPMVGDLTLYDAFIKGYVNDKFFLCELGEYVPDSESRIEERSAQLEGLGVIDALNMETFIRNNLRVFAPEFAAGFGNYMFDNMHILIEATTLTESSTTTEVVGFIDDLMKEAFITESIAHLLPLERSSGVIRAEVEMRPFIEEVEAKK